MTPQQQLMAALSGAQPGTAPRTPSMQQLAGPVTPGQPDLRRPGLPPSRPTPATPMPPATRPFVGAYPGSGPELSECMRALQVALERTMGMSDLAPHIHAPFKSRSILLQQRAVINVPAAFDAAANAGGIALANAESVFQAVLLLTPTNAAPPFDAQLVIQYDTPPGHVAVFKSWGVTVANSRPEAAEVVFDVQGSPNTGTSAPDPLVSGATQELHQPTMLIVPDNKRFTLSIRNLDVGSAILVTISISGWQIPIRAYKDTLKSMVSQPGYGMDCED